MTYIEVSIANYWILLFLCFCEIKANRNVSSIKNFTYVKKPIVYFSVSNNASVIMVLSCMNFREINACQSNKYGLQFYVKSTLVFHFSSRLFFRLNKECQNHLWIFFPEFPLASFDLTKKMYQPFPCFFLHFISHNKSHTHSVVISQNFPQTWNCFWTFA